MWWDSLSNYSQILFIIAVTATFIMLIFIVLMLIGLDNSGIDGIDGLDGMDGLDGIDGMDGLDGIDGVHDIDMGGHIDVLNHEPISGIASLKIFTIRGVLAFFSIGSWVTMLLVDTMNDYLATAIGAVAGFLAAFLLAIALKQAMKLESSGNISYANAIGKTATVYLRVPKEKSGKGKINLVLQDRFVEVSAVTEEVEDLKVNQEVEVVGVIDETTVLVKKI